MNTESVSRKNIPWLEYARAFAIAAVIMNHAVNRTFDMNTDTAAEYRAIPVLLSFIKAFIQIISRTGVPVFLMITGALMLTRDYTDRRVTDRFYRHNWLSLLITSECWYLIIYLCKSVSPDSVFRTRGFAAGMGQLVMNQLFINQDTFSSMWYMPMILCVYLMIPFAALAVQKCGRRVIVIPLVLVLLTGFLIPNINELTRLLGYQFSIKTELSAANLFSIYLLYVITGYYISKGLLSRVPSAALIAALMLVTGATILYQLWAFSRPGNTVLAYRSTGVLVSSALLFEAFRRFIKQPDSIPRAVRFISKYSFGIYFVHVCVMEALQLVISKSIGYIPYFLILAAGSFAGSLAVILVLRRFKKLSGVLFRA